MGNLIHVITNGRVLMASLLLLPPCNRVGCGDMGLYDYKWESFDGGAGLLLTQLLVS